MDTFDHILAQEIKNDTLASVPSDKIRMDLRGEMLKQSALSKSHWNSFIPPVSQYMGKKHWVWKASVAAVLLLSFMGINHMEQGHMSVQMADSTLVKPSVDTLNFQLSDSSFIY